MENMRGAYKVLLALWSVELVLLLVFLIIIGSGNEIGWVFLFFLFFSYMMMLISTAITIVYYLPKGETDKE